MVGGEEKLDQLCCKAQWNAVNVSARPDKLYSRHLPLNN